MQKITELVVRIADLLEAEGRLLRATTMRLATGIALLIIAASTAAVGLIFIISAVFIAVAERAGTAAGAATTGLLALGLGGLLAWLARKTAR